MEYSPHASQDENKEMHKKVAPRFKLVILIVFLICSVLLISTQSSNILSFLQRVSGASLQTHVSSQSSLLSVTAFQNRVFIGTSDGSLNSYRANNGGLLWHVQHSAQPYTYLLATDQIIYGTFFESQKEVIEARSTSNGHVLWSHQFPHLGPLPLMVENGIVYADAQNGTVYALHSDNGQEFWQYITGQRTIMDAYVFIINTVVAIRTHDNIVHVLRSADGSQIASYTPASAGWRPYIDGGAIYIHTGNVVKAYKVSNGANLWQQVVPDSYSGISSQGNGDTYSNWFWIARNGMLYFRTGNGMIEAMREYDGSWAWQKNIGYVVITGPQIENGSIYLSTQDGYLLALQTSNGSLRWKQQIGIPRYSPMLLENGIMYSGSNLSLDAWSGSDGKHLWHYTSSTPIHWYPLDANSILYVQHTNGTLDVLHSNDGSVLWHYPFGNH